MNNAIFFANAGDERGTPQDFFDKLNAEFKFDLDAAASPLNHKCEMYFGEGGIALDALEEDWGGPGSVVYLNPPYSVAGAFVAKAREEADKGAVVVMLLPVRSDTKYWHGLIWDKDANRPADAATILQLDWNASGDWRPGVRGRFLPGRLNFELVVPAAVRSWIKSERTSLEANFSGDDAPKLTDVIHKEFLKGMVDATGLPKMAIERILDDQPDDCLLEGAPFPSCVIVFSKA